MYATTKHDTNANEIRINIDTTTQFGMDLLNILSGGGAGNFIT